MRTRSAIVPSFFLQIIIYVMNEHRRAQSIYREEYCNEQKMNEIKILASFVDRVRRRSL